MSSSGVVGATVANGPVDRFRPMGVFGRPAYQSHVQLRAALMAKLGPRYANYFARPTFDAEQRTIRWTAEVSGEATPWSQLDTERWSRLAPMLEEIRNGLQAYVAELKGVTGGPALASLIEQSMKVPDETHLHAVGDQPVLSFWGFESQAGSSVDASTLSGTRPVVVPMPPPPAPLPEPIPAPPPAPIIIEDDKKKRGVAWWLWLLGLLLLAFVALLIAWLLRCTPPLAGYFANDGFPANIWPSWKSCGSPPVIAPPPPPPVSAPEPRPEEKPVTPPEPVPDADPKRLKIPEDSKKSGDTSFVEGKWEVGPRMQEVTPDGRKLGFMINSMRFDKNGRGVYESVREGGFGPCRGPARAFMENGKLRIETETCVGRDRSIVGMSLVCERKDDGSTECSGRNNGADFKGSKVERFRTTMSKKD